MSVALSPSLPERLLRDLIVADIAPARADLSSEFQGYVKGMVEIEQAQLSSRQEAQEVLKPYESVSASAMRRLTTSDGVPGRYDSSISLDKPGSPCPSCEVPCTSRYHWPSHQGHWVVPVCAW